MQKRSWLYFDRILFLVTLALVLIGVGMAYTAYQASAPSGEGPLLENMVFRQLLFAAIGIVLYIVVAVIDYRVFRSLHLWIYAFALGILGITLAIGDTSFGAQSWLTPGSGIFGVQPSELCKVLMILVWAKYLDDDKDGLESPKPLLISALTVVPPFLLIYRQPDFGTALVLLCIWLGMVFLSGVRWRHILILLGMGAIAVPLGWFQLKGYMRDRILSFFFPGDDPTGASYNITQALISIGSGGWWGKGLLRGTQSQLHFLRVRHTDFVFSVLAEETGFVGSMLLLALFAILIFRLVRIATRAQDNYGRLITAGVATMILIQTFVNLAMNANLLPVTGLPLPLVSYGGSSLLTTMLALGLTQSVAMRRKRDEQTLLSREIWGRER